MRVRYKSKVDVPDNKAILWTFNIKVAIIYKAMEHEYFRNIPLMAKSSLIQSSLPKCHRDSWSLLNSWNGLLHA
jgi:hypothetical protein